MIAGPVNRKESAARGKRSKAERARLRAAYLKELRERAEWSIALTKMCEAMNWPIVFRKSDLKALRKPCSSE